MNTKTKHREIDMLHGSLGNKIIIFVLPLALTGILQQLFNAADVAVIGRFVGKEAMAAVGSNSSVVGLFVTFFIGVSLGTNVVIAKFTGQNRREDIEKAVHTSIMIALISGICLTILGELIAGKLLLLLAVPDNILPMAALYLRVYFLGMPVILLYNFASAIFRSQGDTRTPLICLIISGISNVALNLFFVLVLHRSVDGVAAATVIANAISSGLLFYFLRKNTGLIHVEIKKLRVDSAILKEILSIGVPAGLQSSVFSLSNIVIQSAINSLGSDVMAASSAAFNIEIFAYYLVNSFGQACTTFTGQNYGAGNLARCRKVTRTCMLQASVVTILTSVLMVVFADALLGIFNSDPAVIATGAIRVRFIAGTEIINAVIEIMSGSMRGYGHSLVPALIALIGICVVRIGWVITVFPGHRSFAVLMAAYPISWLVTACTVTAAYFVMRKKILAGFK